MEYNAQEIILPDGFEALVRRVEELLARQGRVLAAIDGRCGSGKSTLAALLAARPAKVFTRQEIYEQVWQQDYFVEDKTINVHISNLRAKLRAAGADEGIETVWGIGFKLKA